MEETRGDDVTFSMQSKVNESVNESALSLKDYPSYRLSVYLVNFIAPVLLILGTFGNVTTLAVLRTRAFRGSSIAFTLSALAVVDTCVLYTSLLQLWLLSLPNGVDSSTALWSFGCKVHMMLIYYLPQLSSWTLVVVTMERSFCVCFPLRSRSLCTPKKVRLLWIGLALVLLAINAHFLWTTAYGLNEKTSLTCHIAPQFDFFFIKVWFWLDAIIVSVVPFLLIFTGNILIVAILVRGTKRRRTELQNSVPMPSLKIITKCGPTPSMTSSTAMLIGISVVFLFTTAPIVVFFLCREEWQRDASYQTLANIYLVYNVTHLLFYTNYATNFLLYCLTGSRFRRTLVNFIRCKSKRTGNETRLNELRSEALNSNLMARFGAGNVRLQNVNNSPKG